MIRPLQVVLAILTLLAGTGACGSPGAAQVATAPDPGWPWPEVASGDGRWRLQLQALILEEQPAPERGSFLQVQAQIVTEDPDVLLGRTPRLKVVAADDTELPAGDMPWPSVEQSHRNMAFFRIPVPEGVRRLTSLEFDCRLVLVSEWRTHVARGVEIGRPAELDAPPYSVWITPERENVSIGAAIRGDRTLDERGEAVAELVSHRWVARDADVREAKGRRLLAQGGAGSGGASVYTFVTDFVGSESGPRTVEYPVSVTVRIPEAWDEVSARFRYEDLELPQPRKL